MDVFYFYFFCIKNTSKMKNTSLQDVFEVLIFVASEFNVLATLSLVAVVDDFLFLVG